MGEWEDEGKEYNSRIWEQFPELHLGGKKKPISAVKTVKSIKIQVNPSPPSESLPSGSKTKCLQNQKIQSLPTTMWLLSFEQEGCGAGPHISLLSLPLLLV